LTSCLRDLFSTEDADSPKQQQLCRQETELELNFVGRETVSQTDLVPSTRNLAALASLYRSVAWFASELNALKAKPEDVISPASPQNLELPMSAITPQTPYLPVLPPVSPTGPLTLPLSREMALRFQALLKTYEQLSELIIDTIRVDIRCRVMHYLDSALQFGNYSVDREAGEPDPHIIDLNADLGTCDNFVTMNLPKKEQQFIFVGLGNLMEHMLISNARHLRLPSYFGIKKIFRNMLALQQSIKSIINDQQNTEFERAKRYYSLFFTSPQDMLDGIRRKQEFSFDEYQTMLNLQCGVTQAGGDAAGASKATDRNYSMYVIDLHGLEMGS